MQQTKEVVKKNPKLSKGVKLFSRSKFNIPHLICNHIIGKEHKIQHRITVGTAIMMIGVLISKSGGGISLIIIHYLFDAIGYGLHGIGLIPWIEYITENVEKRNEEFERNILDLKPIEEVIAEDSIPIKELQVLEEKQNYERDF